MDTDFTMAAGAAATRALLDRAEPPTAIVYANDPMAIAGLGVLQSRRIDVPGQISIVGFDGTEMVRHIYPALTTIVADAELWGATAATTLLRFVAEGHADNVRLPAAQLTHGDSVAPPPTTSTSRTRRPTMHRRNRTILALTAALSLSVTLAACGGSDDGGGEAGSNEAAAKRGPITVWYSNNEQEVAWGKAMVQAWNAAHPDEQVEGQEIPAGKSSEEVIGAAITAGTAPCLVFNTAPAAVGQFQRQGGLVDLTTFPDGKAYIEERSGDVAAAVQGRRQLLPAALEVEPGDDLLQQGPVRQGRPGPGEPEAVHLRRVPGGGHARSRTPRRRKYAIYPAPTSEFFQTQFDFMPLYAAESGGKQIVADGKATFNDPAGVAVAEFWKSIYSQGLAGKETDPGRRVRGQGLRDGHRRAVGDRGVQGHRLGFGAGPDLSRASRRRRPTPSATPRTSACSPPARTRAPPGRC